ncbi:diguanylate cyclase [Ureibacillus composti]|nr:diguanylate cyclase [Ureibacillus composti]
MNNQFLTEEQFNLLFKNSKNFVFFIKKNPDDYVYVYINDSAKEKLLSGNVCGQKISDVMPPIQYETIRENYDRAIESGKQIEYQDYIYLANEVRKYESIVFPSFLDGDIYLLTITKEISYDRDVDDKYLFMRSVFFHSFLSTVLISNDGRLLEANPQFLNDFNINIDEVRGRGFLELPIINQKNVEQLKIYLSQAHNGITLSSKLITFIDGEGELRSFTATFTPLLKSEEEVIAVFIILQEITHYIRQEKALRVTSNGLNNFKNALNNAAEVSITDTNGVMIDVNDRFIEQTEFSREELIGSTHRLINSRYHTKGFFDNLWKTIKSSEVWRGEICNRTKYGVTYWVDSTIIPLVDENGQIEQYLSINFNITEKKRMLTELHNIENMFKMITENTNDLIVITNEDGIIQFASSAYCKKLGYTVEELIGQFYTQILTKESKEIWNAELYNLTGNSKIELIHESKDGISLWTECNYTVVNNYLRNNGSQIIMVSREITERKEFENKLLFLAYHDTLTQLPNRRYIQKEFPYFLEKAKSNKESIAVLYVDGDNFKAVNDQFGHDVGDEFIKQFGKALSKSVRSQDLVVRVGGDEFVLVITGLNPNKTYREQQLQHIINRIKENLKEGWTIVGNHFSPTSSMGISFYPDHGSTLDELMDCADRALHDIKVISKDSYKIYSHE